MSLSVCDKEPCTAFKSAIEKLVVVPKDDLRFNFTVIGKSKVLKTFYVQLEYCPFCGTRVEPEWVKMFIRSAGKRVL